MVVGGIEIIVPSGGTGDLVGDMALNVDDAYMNRY